MKRIKLNAVLIFLICLSLVPSQVSAAIQAGSYTLTPHAGGYMFEGSQDLDDGPVYGIGFGYNYTGNFGVEAVFDYIDTENKLTGNKEEGYIYRIDGLYHFMPNRQLVPYVAAGLGAITLDTGNDDNTVGLFDYGAGLKYAITEKLALRGDIRHLIDFDDPNNNMAYTLGLTFLFGGKEKAAPPPEPKDSDSDGVYDDMDICPDTPLSAAVDRKGCPLDSDRDGVYDHKDQCPGTPAGAPVDTKGCPLDSDRDGVYDHKDQCPGTPADFKVDSTGCPVPLKIELKVEFQNNSDIVKNAYHKHLREVADFLKNHPDTTAVIEGHTDSLGGSEYNLGLSQRRAENVVRHLIEYGVSPSRLKAIGYGESRPVADNATEAGRQKNRRVIAVISAMAKKN